MLARVHDKNKSGATKVVKLYDNRLKNQNNLATVNAQIINSLKSVLLFTWTAEMQHTIQRNHDCSYQ